MTVGLAAAAGLVGRQRLLRPKGLPQRNVDVHGTGSTARRRPVGAAGKRAYPAQALGCRLGNAELDEPFDGVPVELDLVDRLPGTDVAQLRWAVGREQVK